MPANPRITLIITTYNWPAALDLTLRSVARQSMLPDEIIVADDGSGPQTRQVVTQWQQRLRPSLNHVWQADEGFQLARSRNRAIAAARGDYLVIALPRSLATRLENAYDFWCAAICRSCPTINPALSADQRGSSRNS